jgi:hypothetical protein
MGTFIAKFQSSFFLENPEKEMASVGEIGQK